MSDHGFSTSAILAALALASAAACTTPYPDATSSSADLSAGNANGKANAKTKTKSAETSQPTSKTQAPSGATCAAKATQNECAKCCGGEHGERVASEMQALAKCVCETSRAACGSACDQGYCSGAKGAASSDSGCGCIPDLTPCVAVGKRACDVDPTCVAATRCNLDAKCDKKPAT